MREAEEAEREQQRGSDRSPGPPRLEATGDDQHLAEKQRRGREAGQSAQRQSHHAAEGGIGSRDARDCALGRTRRVLEQRCRGVEAEGLRNGVGGDVNGDTGERQRRSEPDTERDHAHVLETRVRQQPFPGQRAPEKRDRHCERHEPEEDQDVLSRPRPDHRRERVLGAPRDEQHHRQERCGEQRRDRRRRLGVRVGKPVVHRRPADLRGQACEQEDVGDERALTPRRVGREGVPGERPDPTAGDARGQDDDPEQSDAETE